MSWVTIVWSMIAAACLTLGLTHGLVWSRRRQSWTHCFFALSAVGTAGLAASELWMMRAQTPDQFGAALRLGHVPAWLLIVSLLVFVRLYLEAGRVWLAWTICALRTLSLVLNFIFSPNLNYREITILRPVSFLGDSVSVAEGVRNPWMLLGQSSLLLLVLFVADAALSAWRRGDRRQALLVGGSIVLFTSAGTAQAILIFWGFVHAPFMASIFYLGTIVMMAIEMSHDLLRTAELSRQLRESDRRMSLAVDAANFGIWIRDLNKNEIWATAKWRELYGFTPDEELNMTGIFDRLHPGDRDALTRVLAQAQACAGGYEIEYRVLLPDGRLRWITSHGLVEADALGRAAIVRSASRDCTIRKLAEEAAHNLSGRLIHAQEETQKQFGRELHDDFCQSLAMLSVELEIFGRKAPATPELIAERIDAFSTQVKSLSSRVHRLSHELHPAKLDLGLVPAVRGFCREFALAHQLAVEFVDRDVPQIALGDTALCLYRIAQEALHNVIKHSGASLAKVELSYAGGQLRLVVTDDGHGFDPLGASRNGSLGLVSMSERARFVGGSLTIESRPGAGARVDVRVPIPRINGFSHDQSHHEPLSV